MARVGVCRGARAVVPGGRRFHGPVGFLGSGVRARVSVSGRGQGEGSVEGVGELVCPGPGLRDFDLSFALAADDAGGGVCSSR
jgi:hypothetical protein